MKSRVSVVLVSLSAVLGLAAWFQWQRAHDSIGFSGETGHNTLPRDDLSFWDRVEKSKFLRLYAIDPGKSGDGPKFNGYAISDFKTITNNDDIVEIARILRKADGDNDGVAAACFDPRHGIVFDGGWALICFECLHYQTSSGGGLISDLGVEPMNEMYRKVGITPVVDDRKK